MNGRCFANPTTCSGDDDYFVLDSRHQSLLRSIFAGEIAIHRQVRPGKLTLVELFEKTREMPSVKHRPSDWKP
jgi:hypothetical protein